jgi:class 3 adenylate cyclase/WD40 repeat protein/energy-coupling factor transporter ATP-binding protein EcfA2
MGMGTEAGFGGTAQLLSFLIADIRGYTAFTQSRGDEAAAELAGKFARVAREGIEAHEGRLLELRGDEALAVFTSARASLRAAVALQEVFADETTLDPGLPLTVGMGLDAGEVVPVEGGYRGGALNRAARLCSLAKAGEALASAGVAHLAGAVEEVTLSEWGTAQVKGLAEPVRAYTVSSSNGTRPVPQLVTLSLMPATLESAVPMIGRDSELRRLSWAWRQARRSCGQLALVRGPSGIGKTRLLSAVAEVAVHGGGTAWFCSMAAAEPDLDGLRKALTTEASPVLVAVDDLDVAPEVVADVLRETGSLARRPALVLLAVDEEHATDEGLRAVRSLNAGLDVSLRPLDPESVRRVAALYLESPDAVSEVPAGLLESTGGVPRRVHQSVASWVEERATRRLGVLASQAAGSRSEVTVVESQLAGTVADLQAVRERARLYGLGPGRHGGVPEESPYKGLDSFGPEDAEAFFGRERLVADLVARVAGGGLVGVVGPSGSGKSSLVRAGLIPAVAAGVLPGSQDWVTVVVRPGEHPVRALDVAVLPVLPTAVAAVVTGDQPLLVQLGRLEGAPHVLVVVDQAEELFTVCTDDAERGVFVDGLVAAAADPGGRIDVVLTVRADYYGRFAGDQRLASAIAANQVLVGPMAAEEYRRAITRPAQRHGVTVEPGLVDALVDEVTGQSGALPLLSTALVELWQARADRTMTLASYQATGGLHAAVARLAESVYGDLEPAQQRAARRMFLRLTGPGAGDTVVKRRVRLTDLAVDQDSSALVDLLARRRLLTVDDGAVEVAHEALLREWPRFQRWLEEDREGVRLRAHLADAAANWEADGRDQGELYRGARLSATLDWTTSHADDLSPLEQEFVTASGTEHQRATAQQQRQNRRLRGLLAGAAVLLVFALVAGSVALAQREQAQRQTEAAEESATSAEARSVGARALLTDDIPRSMLMAVAAYRLEPSAATLSQLQQVISAHPELLRTGYGSGADLAQVASGSDGQTVAVHETDGTVGLYYLFTLAPLASTQVGDPAQLFPEAGPLAFSPDESTLAAAATPSKRPLQLLDATTLEPLPEQLGGWPKQDQMRVGGIDYSKDGTRLAVAVDYPPPGFDPEKDRVTPFSQSGQLLVYDTSRLERPISRIRLNGSQGVELSPDGRTAYIASPFVAYDVATGRELARNDNIVSFTDFDLNPAGTRMVTLGYAEDEHYHDLVILDPRTGRILEYLPGLTGNNPLTVAWSQDGHRIAGAADDGSVVVWDAKTGEVEHTYATDNGSVRGLAFRQFSEVLVTAGSNRQIQLWDVLGYDSYLERVEIARERQVPTGSIVPTPDGRGFSYEGTPPNGGKAVTFLDGDSRELGETIRLPDEQWFGAGGWSPDGERFVTGFGDGVVRVLDPATEEVVVSRSTGGGLVTQTDYTADGSEILASTRSGEVRILDSTTLEPVRDPMRFRHCQVPNTCGGGVPADQVLTVTANPRDHTAFVVLGGPATSWYEDYAASRWALIDTDERTVIRQGDLGIEAVEYATFSPDGVHALAVGRRSQLVVIDTRTGEATVGPTAPQQGTILYAFYNRDGSRFVTGSDDQTARLWDAATGDQLGVIRIPDGVPSTSFLDDDTMLMTSGAGAVYQWDPSADAAITFACHAAGRDLTEDEWEDIFEDRPYEETCPVP